MNKSVLGSWVLGLGSWVLGLLGRLGCDRSIGASWFLGPIPSSPHARSLSGLSPVNGPNPPIFVLRTGSLSAPGCCRTDSIISGLTSAVAESSSIKSTGTLPTPGLNTELYLFGLIYFIVYAFIAFYTAGTYFLGDLLDIDFLGDNG